VLDASDRERSRPPLSGIRVCDLSGQLAGAGATRTLAAFGAQVIRVEDPRRQGRWDIMRGSPPYVDDRRGLELGCAYNNANVEKLAITLDLRQERGRELVRALIARSDVVTENFSAGVMDRLGLGWTELQRVKPDIIYVSNSGFGHSGPYSRFKSWGPIVQALSGLTATSAIAGQPAAGWGFSYMDHHGANFMTIAILAALRHRARTGEGQWVDISGVEAASAMVGPRILAAGVNGPGEPLDGSFDSNHSEFAAMVPHNIYAVAGEDDWIAVACRNDGDWHALATCLGTEWANDPDLATLAGRQAREQTIDIGLAAWCRARSRADAVAAIQSAGVPCEPVLRPSERIDDDPRTAAWGLWPVVEHPVIGKVRVEGLPIHLDNDWSITAPAPMLGQHNNVVLSDLLGLTEAEIEQLRADAVI
jgi:benzylsuccinate CoA-transferase BbsF subunit